MDDADDLARELELEDQIRQEEEEATATRRALAVAAREAECAPELPPIPRGIPVVSTTSVNVPPVNVQAPAPSTATRRTRRRGAVPRARPPRCCSTRS